MKIIAIIPARAGSKRLPNKNKLSFCGKPLISWTIEETMKVTWFHEIIISSDDDDIIQLAEKYQKDDNRIKIHIRPNELAQDDTKMSDVMKNIFPNHKYEEFFIIVLLQPTSPLRNYFDINDAIEQYLKNMRGLVSLSQRNIKEYFINGAIYIRNSSAILDGSLEFYEDFGLGYIMNNEDGIDIDTQEDFDKAQEIKARRLKYGD